MKIEFYKHSLGREEKDALAASLDSVFLTTGDITYKAEKMIADYLGVKSAVCLDSCTAALHLALKALDIGPGDEVITTPMTFAATANAIIMAGARPVFADVDPETGNIDPQAVRKALTKNTRAIIPVHLYGLLCDMTEIKKIADERNLKVVEDSAHCIEADREGVKPGTLGACACLSFYATKNITCAEGGCFVTNDKNLAEKVRILSQHGITRPAALRYGPDYKPWDMIMMGWKYNLDNIRSSLLIPQIKNIDELRRSRSRLAGMYEKKLKGIPGITFPSVQKEEWTARHLFTIWVEPEARERLIKGLNEDGIGVAVNYTPVHLLSYYKNLYGYKKGDFPRAEKIGESTISLPLYPKLKTEELDYVVECLKKRLN